MPTIDGKYLLAMLVGSFLGLAAVMVGNSALHVAPVAPEEKARVSDDPPKSEE